MNIEQARILSATLDNRVEVILNGSQFVLCAVFLLSNCTSQLVDWVAQRERERMFREEKPRDGVPIS